MPQKQKKIKIAPVNIRSVILFTFLMSTLSCSSLKSLKPGASDKELFAYAKDLKERSYYIEALTHLKKLTKRFIYSPLVKEAELLIADIYFLQENWTQALKAYALFIERRPDSDKVDYASFKLALSHYKQLPLTEDRDLSLSQKTLFYFNSHLEKFPKSSYRLQVKKHKEAVMLLLAQKEWMIARFYIKKDKFISALPYLKELKKNYFFLLSRKESQASKKSVGKIRGRDFLPSLEDLTNWIKKIQNGENI